MSRRSKSSGFFRYAPVVLFLITSAIAAEPNLRGERVWKGQNGATFLGTYHGLKEQGSKVMFGSSKGKLVIVAFENLSEEDQKVVLKLEGKLQEPDPSVSGSKPEDFKKLPVVDRGLIPQRKITDFGGDYEESMVNCLWESLLWWNAFDVMPVPKRGDFDDKAEWLFEELTRYIEKGGSRAARIHGAKEGIEKYFSKRLEDIGACQVRTDTGLLDPAKLSSWATGNTIVILRMTMVFDDGDEYVECGTLAKMDENGEFILHIQGGAHKGRMVISPERNQAKRVAQPQIYEMVITDRNALTDHHFKNGARFYLNEPSGWNGALILEPFVYKTPGEPIPLPGAKLAD